MRGDHRHPHAGGRDPQVGHAEDLARLVADLELLGGPAVRLDRAGPGHHVERERRRERAEVADRGAHVTGQLPEHPGRGDLVELVVQRVDADLAGARGGLVRGTTSSCSPNSRCSAPIASIIDSVVQLGFEMIPLGRLRPPPGFTSGTTSGTSGSIRNAPELSTATAPRAAAIGAHCAETSSGTSNIATSTPSNTSGPAPGRRPPRRARAAPCPRTGARPSSRISPQTSSRVDRMPSMTVPTAPVAPTTASVGLPPRRSSSSRTSVHHGLGLAAVQAEGAVRGADGIVHVLG